MRSKRRISDAQLVPLTARTLERWIFFKIKKKTLERPTSVLRNHLKAERLCGDIGDAAAGSAAQITNYKCENRPWQENIFEGRWVQHRSGR